MELFKSVCKNPWCKATFLYKEEEMIEEEEEKCAPKQCQKCRSFETELSAGVEWSEKTYEGPRVDSSIHQIKYRVTNFKL